MICDCCDQPTPNGVSRLRKKDERGFVIVLLALIMSALFLMAGFAVDLGYWYLRSAQIQRAADAASLAGSIDMPDVNAAAADAQTSAAKNGFANGVNGISVVVTPTTGGKVTVKITDPKVATFFTAMILDHINIGRQASAERLSPVPMGTPYNVMGGGDLNLGSIPQQHFWLAVNGYCTPKEDGDFYSAGYDGNRHFVTQANPNAQPIPDYTDCSGAGSELNTDYKSTGYDYIITVPAHTSGQVNVSIYDPEFDGWCTNSDRWSSFPNDAGYTPQANSSCTPTISNPATMNTTYTLYDTQNSDSTVDDTQMNTATYGYSVSSALVKQWVPIGNLPTNSSDTPHKYRLNVSTPPVLNSYGVNTFAIEALRSWNTSYCDARVTADCPQIAGAGAMSIDAAAVDTTGYDTFYLAQIDPSYAGDTLTLSLWDPGEGFQEVRLISPDGEVVPVRWSATPAALGQTTAPGYGVDVSDTGCPKAAWDSTVFACPQPGINRYGNDKLNDRLVTVTAQIPTNYLAYIAKAAGSTWWSVQYQAAAGHPATLNDRTTWLVSIGGQQPAHLVPTG